MTIRYAEHFSCGTTRLDWGRAALVAVTEAASIWDTSETKRLRDELALAARCRRDRIGIWDFQVRGDPAAISWSALPLLISLAANLSLRFDLVGRQSLYQLVSELGINLDAIVLDEVSRRELAKMLRVAAILCSGKRALFPATR